VGLANLQSKKKRLAQEEIDQKEFKQLIRTNGFSKARTRPVTAALDCVNLQSYETQNPNEFKENATKRSGRMSNWRVSSRGTLRMKQSGSNVFVGYGFVDPNFISTPIKQLKSIYKKIEGLQTSIGCFKKEMTKNSNIALLGAHRNRFEDNIPNI
jgi:hypothetical protein